MTRQNFSDHIDSDAKVEQPDAVFDNASTIEVEFEYPLAKPARVIFKAANGFSRQTFFNEVRETYRHIYKQEALTTTIAKRTNPRVNECAVNGNADWPQWNQTLERKAFSGDTQDTYRAWFC